MIWLLLFLAAALLMVSMGALGWRTSPAPGSLFDRRDCPHCGTSTARGTGCLSCGTWVGR